LKWLITMVGIVVCLLFWFFKQSFFNVPEPEVDIALEGTQLFNLKAQEAATQELSVAPTKRPVPGSHEVGSVSTPNTETKKSPLATFLDKTKPVEERIPLDITSAIPQIQNAEALSLVARVLRDSSECDLVRNEAANLLWRSRYAGLTDDLIEVLNNPQESPRFRSFCVQHLRTNNKLMNPEEFEKIKAVLRTLLDDRDVPVRREVLLALVRMGDPLGQETAVKWLLDQNDSNTRDLAIRCVHDLNMKEYIPTIRKYLYDPDEVIRIAAIVALSQWGDEESRPAFEAAAKSDTVRLQRAGQAALTRLSQFIPPNSNP